MRGHYYCSHTQYWKPFTQITEMLAHTTENQEDFSWTGRWGKQTAYFNTQLTQPRCLLWPWKWPSKHCCRVATHCCNKSRHPGHAKLHHVSCTYNLERRLSDSTSAINAAGMGKFLSWREGKRDSTWLSSTSTLAAFEFWWSLPRLIYFTSATSRLLSRH